jgi:hypothetical protein
MNTLNLTLKKKWFDMIASGEKKEEYREIKGYWIARLTWHEYHGLSIDSILALQFVNADVLRRDIDIVSANNGYAKDCPNVKWKHEGILIGEGNPEWGAELGKKYFILKIGELLNN